MDGPGDAAREVEVRGEWAVPEGVTIAAEVDLTASDPAVEHRENRPSRRRCIAASKAGTRCRVNAIAGLLLCPAHAGRLDSSAGGRAKAQKSLAIRQEAEERMVQAAMGARAIIRQTIIDHADELRETVSGLARDASAGDRRAQTLLLGYLDQGFGRATVQAGETTPPDGSTHLATLSDDDLRKLAFPSNQEA